MGLSMSSDLWQKKRGGTQLSHRHLLGPGDEGLVAGLIQAGGGGKQLLVAHPCSVLVESTPRVDG